MFLNVSLKRNRQKTFPIIEKNFFLYCKSISIILTKDMIKIK